jgi:translation initiation factor 3 subunit A
MSFQMQAHLQPKNALRKCRDFLKVGRVVDGCNALHEAITSKRGPRIWTPEHEELVTEFIKLCVELKDPRKAKDGLYHYRQLAQQQAPASLEKLINLLLEISAQKAADARARAEVGSAGAAPGAKLPVVDDLEEEQQSPESLLMGAVTSEGSKERAEREILVPWVRHMWDTYRNVLDTLRSSPRMEGLYHNVAQRAMAFCKSYGRSAEFRKLCKMLRDHFAMQRRSHDSNGTVMSVESVERHLLTRFVQLEHCADMSLWNEGFRTIEDIYGACAGGGRGSRQCWRASGRSVLSPLMRIYLISYAPARARNGAGR